MAQSRRRGAEPGKAAERVAARGCNRGLMIHCERAQKHIGVTVIGDGCATVGRNTPSVKQARGLFPGELLTSRSGEGTAQRCSFPSRRRGCARGTRAVFPKIRRNSQRCNKRAPPGNTEV